MNVIRLATVICLVALGGCQTRNGVLDSGATEKAPPQEGLAHMLEIKSFALEGDFLRIDYCLVNRFPRDIWICEDVDVTAPNEDRDVETKVIGDTLRIELRFRLSSNYEHERVFAQYRRLPKGHSYLGTIRLRLPIKNWSPVYLVEDDVHTTRRLTVLHCAILEVGYFTENLPTLVCHSEGRGWHVPASQMWQLPSEDSDVVFLWDVWEGLELERAVLATVDHVQIPVRLGGMDWPGPSPASGGIIDWRITRGRGDFRGQP